MTRRDFNACFHDTGGTGHFAKVAWEDVWRIAEMVADREGFAPEPPTEGDVREWLGRDNGPFQDRDLSIALKQGRRHGIHVTLDSTTHGRWSVIDGTRMYDCASLRVAARTVAALAYAAYHRGADVNALLGGLT